MRKHDIIGRFSDERMAEPSAFSERVKRIMCAQPLNPLIPLAFRPAARRSLASVSNDIEAADRKTALFSPSDVAKLRLEIPGSVDKANGMQDFYAGVACDQLTGFPSSNEPS